EIVHVEPAPGASLVGRIVAVEIARANRHSLLGTLTGGAISPAVAAPPPDPPAAAARPARRALPVLLP
ncbi:MAG: tRNA (N6-isopentenyl adenosine(37)-C2)-methylthiotransferase MiaB, partial [Myxococcales bacterium]|nr:tRNA (N6-isopentenyl adenosine(37)-C2)-methylthiotransferase MiaB [Myxococcales bacterium]